MARRAQAGTAVVAGADLRLAEAATPYRPRHADIARNDRTLERSPAMSALCQKRTSKLVWRQYEFRAGLNYYCRNQGIVR